MISEASVKTIKECAHKFAVNRVWLFGSSMEEERGAVNDIDLAVEGLSPDLFFKFYAQLFMSLSKPVDLVDLSQNPPIAEIIRKRGMCIYER